MSDRGRSPSPKPLRDVDMDMENGESQKDVKVVVVNGLSRNVVQTHLQTIFGFYGEIIKIDLPLYSKCKIFTLSYPSWKPSHSSIQPVKTEGKLRWSMLMSPQRTRRYPT